jgi:hypothetical protein
VMVLDPSPAVALPSSPPLDPIDRIEGI